MVDQRLEETLKQQFSNQPNENYRVLTFGELCVGDWCISLPIPGDNSGHGGFADTYYLFEKTERSEDKFGSYINAVRVRDNIPSGFPDSMPVIKVE